MYVQRDLVLFQIDQVGQRISARVQLQFAVRLVQHVRMSDMPQQYGVLRVIVVHLTRDATTLSYIHSIPVKPVAYP